MFKGCFFKKLAGNALPVKPCAVKTFDKQETLISIGFTGLLCTGDFIFLFV